MDGKKEFARVTRNISGMTSEVFLEDFYEFMRKAWMADAEKSGPFYSIRTSVHADGPARKTIELSWPAPPGRNTTSCVIQARQLQHSLLQVTVDGLTGLVWRIVDWLDSRYFGATRDLPTTELDQAPAVTIDLSAAIIEILERHPTKRPGIPQAAWNEIFDLVAVPGTRPDFAAIATATTKTNNGVRKAYERYEQSREE